MPESDATAVAPVAAAPVLAVRALAALRGERPLFRGLDLRLEPAQLIWLRGRNGRGKTTLLRMLAGLSSPARGEIRLDAHPVQRLPVAWRQRLVYVAHANALKDDLSAGEALGFLGRLHGLPHDAASVRAALSRLGVAAWCDAPVRRLSQGQRRRVALARLALAQAPAVWLLDEPFDALDDEGVRALHGLLAEHARRGGSAMLTSHQPPGLSDPEPLSLDLDAYAVSSRPAAEGSDAPRTAVAAASGHDGPQAGGRA